MVHSKIIQAGTCEELAAVREDWTRQIQQSRLIEHPLAWNEHLNEVHDSIIRRTLFLSESKLLEKGEGFAPCSYAYILFGSGGRKEQTLWSDQDSGLVYAPAEEDKERAAEYFASFAEQVTKGLETAGYPPCDGHVISSSAFWRRPIGDWRQQLEQWARQSNWEANRYLLIFSDMRCVYGDSFLTESLRKYFYQLLKHHPSLLQGLVNNTLHRKVATGFFGQLIREKYGQEAGSVDVKYGTYIPLVNGIRLLALLHGSKETATLDRLSMLRTGQLLSSALADELQDAFQLTIKHRSLSEGRFEEGYYVTSGKVPSRMLTKSVRKEIKAAVKAGKQLQQQVESIVKAFENGRISV